jgi:hypothetical protein
MARRERRPRVTVYDQYGKQRDPEPAPATDSDEKVRVSGNDSTADYLATKLLAGENVTLTVGNEGANETLTIAADGSAPGEGPGIDVVGSAVGLGGDMVLLYHSDGSPVNEYATVSATAAAASSGDAIHLQAKTYTEDVTIPAGVAVWGHGNSIIDGQVTLSAGAQLNAVGVIRSGDQAGELVGIVGPESGYADVDHCWVEVTNATGPAYALQVGAGKVYVRNTPTKAAGGEASYAVYGQCANCYLYSPEPVEAQTAGVDSMPWGTESTSETFESAPGNEVGLLCLTEGVIPANWYTAAFDDSAWTASVDRGHEAEPFEPVGTSIWVAVENEYRDGGYHLYRREFTITNASPTGTLEIGGDNYIDAVYINETLVFSGGEFNTLDTLSIGADVLQQGTNLLAVQVRNYVGENYLNFISLDYRLTVAGAAGSTSPNVHACIIPNADGRASALPEWGDRSAWEVGTYGARHASDWAAGDSHHAAVTLGAGSDAALSLSGQELTLADVLTPTEHDALDHTGLTGVVGGGWTVDYAATIPAPLTAGIPGPVEVEGSGTLDVQGELYVL